jgi:dipeptidyl aminopeptidase/acylaminoacyl peptidase
MTLSLAIAAAIGVFIGIADVRLRAQNAGAPVGLFENHGDIGTVLHAGSVEYDAATGTYTVTGSGENMWSTADAFQFVWKKVSGDVTLTADISFLGTGGNPHRKAVLMIRQSLDADSPYADVAVHGVGMTAIQFREEKGATTQEVQANVTTAPQRVRIEKRGDYFHMLTGEGKELQLAAGSPRIPITGDFYVGIGVCSHDKDVTERAVFSHVDLETSTAAPPEKPGLYSTLEVVSIASASVERRAVYATPGRIEAPNWTRDGKWLLFNRDGRMERLPADGGQPQIIDTGIATRCNNDHVLSPDGTLLAISDMSQEEHKSIIYIVPLAGGAPRRITMNSPSYCHGWSPDGKTLAFCGERNGNYDVYTIPAAGGEETRLTTAAGIDDGPEYSPDGKYIYFNSVRTGRMQIWRMGPDGSNQEQVTSDEFNNWFAHISPDGKWMVFLSYDKDVTGHPGGTDVMLRLMALDGGKKITVLARLFGGQGTINVTSWSPDSQRLAFVSYHLLW